MTKILYLHGLESPHTGPKIDFLNEKFGPENILAPKMEYSNKGLFYKTLAQAKQFFADDNDCWVIGSSMGGYFSFYLSQLLPKTKCLVFNPAVYKFPALADIKVTKQQIIVLSKHDDVISNVKVVEFYTKEKVKFKRVDIDAEHRIPELIFYNIIDKFIV